MKEYILAMQNFDEIYKNLKSIDNIDAFITLMFQLIDKWGDDHHMTKTEKVEMVEETLKIYKYLKIKEDKTWTN